MLDSGCDYAAECVVVGVAVWELCVEYWCVYVLFAMTVTCRLPLRRSPYGSYRRISWW